MQVSTRISFKYCRQQLNFSWVIKGPRLGFPAPAPCPGEFRLISSPTTAKSLCFMIISTPIRKGVKGVRYEEMFTRMNAVFGCYVCTHYRGRWTYSSTWKNLKHTASNRCHHTNTYLHDFLTQRITQVAYKNVACVSPDATKTSVSKAFEINNFWYTSKIFSETLRDKATEAILKPQLKYGPALLHRTSQHRSFSFLP